FCTSGQLMVATALLKTTPRPTAEQARAAMTGNLCRCSNYNRYIEAVTGAPPITAATSAIGLLKTLGHATPRIDGVERVTGKATYTGDVRIPGMLYARVLRSPHPHARI